MGGSDIFTVAADESQQPRLHATFPSVLVTALAQLIAHLGDPPNLANGPIVTVSGADTDVFAQLESEMVTDAVTQQISNRRADATKATLRLLGSARPADGSPFSPHVGINGSLEDAQLFLEWLNRTYVTLRLSELPTAAAVGQGQPVLFDDEPDPSTGPAPLEGMTLLLAALVESLQGALVAASR